MVAGFEFLCRGTGFETKDTPAFFLTGLSAAGKPCSGPERRIEDQGDSRSSFPRRRASGKGVEGPGKEGEIPPGRTPGNEVFRQKNVIYGFKPGNRNAAKGFGKGYFFPVPGKNTPDGLDDLFMYRFRFLSRRIFLNDVQGKGAESGESRFAFLQVLQFRLVKVTPDGTVFDRLGKDLLQKIAEKHTDKETGKAPDNTGKTSGKRSGDTAVSV
jgi:hypothetical protein